MISDNLRCTPRLARCLDMLERADGRVVRKAIMKEAMYPPPMTPPTDFTNLLKVTVCQIRKRLRAAESPHRIKVVWGLGYYLVRSNT